MDKHVVYISFSPRHFQQTYILGDPAGVKKFFKQHQNSLTKCKTYKIVMLKYIELNDNTYQSLCGRVNMKNL